MMNQPRHSQSAFFTLISVFFFWGFVAASNDILIPVFKERLGLEQWQSQMISFAFYVAYTFGALIYMGVSKILGQDLLNKLGYKNGIALGLVISAFGTLLFYPAAQMSSFPVMITGLFVIGLGFSLQQTAANPLAINMGDLSKGSQRLSMAGGVNNIGTTIGPVVVSLAIFGAITASTSVSGIEMVQKPYLILGLAFLVVAVIFKSSSIPNQIYTPAAVIEKESASPEAHTILDDQATRESARSAFSFPQLWMGMIAIFVYVGVEVSTAANLPEFMRQYLGTSTKEVAPYVSLFWASLMIGRWSSSVGAFQMSSIQRKVLGFVVPYAAFGVFLLVNYLAGNNMEPFFRYLFIIPVIIIADWLSKDNPVRQLVIFSGLGIAALLIGMLGSGLVSVYAFISVGLFCSTLWPCIYTLAIAGLGKHTNQGSSLLIMMIMGGGVISLLQGFLSKDSLLGIQLSYTVGVICFIYLVFYGVRTAAILKKQGVSYIKTNEGNH